MLPTTSSISFLATPTLARRRASSASPVIRETWLVAFEMPLPATCVPLPTGIREAILMTDSTSFIASGCFSCNSAYFVASAWATSVSPTFSAPLPTKSSTNLGVRNLSPSNVISPTRPAPSPKVCSADLADCLSLTFSVDETAFPNSSLMFPARSLTAS